MSESNPNDRVRDAILRHLYDVHRGARSPRSAATGIRALQQVLRSAGYKQQEVASNLDYLLQKGWVCEVVENRTFTTPRGTTQQAQKRAYKISDVGIDRLEAASAFERSVHAPQVNITSIAGVTVIGEGNIVNTHFTELFKYLDELKGAVLNSHELPELQKLNITADLHSLQAQLQKPEPDKSVVKALWATIERAVVASGFAEMCGKVSAMLSPLIG